MENNKIPEFAIVGHPNEGKSSVVSTLSEDDSVKVSPTPGETTVCRVFPVKIDNREIIRFTDTPGFQSPRAALRWMKDHGETDTRELLIAFMEAHRNNDKFEAECELFSPIINGAGIIYIADASRPMRKGDRVEMEILRMTGLPRMAIINRKDTEDDSFLDEWKNESKKNFNLTREFNAHNANYAERIELLESLNLIDQDWQPALKKVISAFKEEWKRRNEETAELICNLLANSLRHFVTENYREQSEEVSVKKKLQKKYQTEIEAIEKKAHRRIKAAFKHRKFELPVESILHKDIFAEETWRVLGLSQVQVVIAGAAAGAAVGAYLDVANAGLSMGALAAIGATVGAVSAFFVRKRIADVTTVGFQLKVGPNKDIQFLYILLDRALIYYSYVINWAHGWRPTHENDMKYVREESGKKGFVHHWDKARLDICGSFFRDIHSGSIQKREEAKEKLTALLMDVLDEISHSEIHVA